MARRFPPGVQRWGAEAPTALAHAAGAQHHQLVLAGEAGGAGAARAGARAALHGLRAAHGAAARGGDTGRRAWLRSGALRSCDTSQVFQDEDTKASRFPSLCGPGAAGRRSRGRRLGLGARRRGVLAPARRPHPGDARARTRGAPALTCDPSRGRGRWRQRREGRGRRDAARPAPSGEGRVPSGSSSPGPRLPTGGPSVARHADGTRASQVR